MQFIWLDGGGPVECSYLGLIGSASSASHSVSIAGGDDVSGRILACALHFFGASGSSPTLTSATFDNGTSIPAVTPYVQAFQFGSPALGGDEGSGFVWAVVPSGNPVTLDLTFNVAVALNVGTFRVVNAISSAPVDTAALGFFVGAGVPATINIDTQADGVLLAAMTGFHLTSMAITAGVTEDYNTDIVPGSDFWRAGGHHLTASEINRAVTVSNGGGSSMLGAVVAVSFR